MFFIDYTTYSDLIMKADVSRAQLVLRMNFSVRVDPAERIKKRKRRDSDGLSQSLCFLCPLSLPVLVAVATVAGGFGARELRHAKATRSVFVDGQLKHQPHRCGHWR
jgi:hypothetical protein